MPDTGRFRIVAAAAACCLLCLHLGAATISEAIARIQAVRSKTDFRAEGRLVSVDSSGRRTTWRLSLKGKSFPSGLKVMFEVSDPAPSRLRLLIESPAAGLPRVRIAAEQDRKVEELTPARWGDPFLGTGLAYEDLIDAHFSWNRQALLREEKCGSRNCYVIRSQPGPDEPSHYAGVTSWTGSDICFPTRVEKVIRKSGAIKEFLYYGIRESRGAWGARQLDVRIKGEANQTLLIMTKGGGTADLTERDFDITRAAGEKR